MVEPILRARLPPDLIALWKPPIQPLRSLSDEIANPLRAVNLSKIKSLCQRRQLDRGIPKTDDQPPASPKPLGDFLSNDRWDDLWCHHARALELWVEVIL